MSSNNIRVLRFFYDSIIIFFILILILPLRVAYEISLSIYNLIFVAHNLPFIISRGSILFILALIIFIISIFLFRKFYKTEDGKFAKYGYIASLISCLFAGQSILINYIIYFYRMINIASIYIGIVLVLTELNISTLIFLRRNDLEDVKQSKKIKKHTKIDWYCPKCGTKREIEYKFCINCGFSFNKLD